MVYYTLPRIGTGTDEDPFRPDVEPGTSWVGAPNGTDYLIATPSDLPAKTGRTKRLPRQALENAAHARGIQYADLMRWRVV